MSQSLSGIRDPKNGVDDEQIKTASSSGLTYGTLLRELQERDMKIFDLNNKLTTLLQIMDNLSKHIEKLEIDVGRHGDTLKGLGYEL